MKSFILPIVFLCAVLYACKKEAHVFMDEGQITGPDPRDCACCGGWFLKTADTTFLFDQLPWGSSIDLNTATFPIPVKFDYKADTTGCGKLMNRIILIQIAQY